MRSFLFLIVAVLLAGQARASASSPAHPPTREKGPIPLVNPVDPGPHHQPAHWPTREKGPIPLVNPVEPGPHHLPAHPSTHEKGPIPMPPAPLGQL